MTCYNFLLINVASRDLFFLVYTQKHLVRSDPLYLRGERSNEKLAPWVRVEYISFCHIVINSEGRRQQRYCLLRLLP